MKTGLKDILYGERIFLIPYLLLMIVCLVIKLNFTKDEIYFAVNTRNTAWGDAIAQYVTDVGDGWTTIILSFILLLFNYLNHQLPYSVYH